MITAKSEIISRSVQIDGRIGVTELHTSDTGTTQVLYYLADAKTDLDSALTIHSNEVVWE